MDNNQSNFPHTDRHKTFTATAADWDQPSVALNDRRLRLADLTSAPVWLDLVEMLEETLAPYRCCPPREPNERVKYETFHIMRDVCNEFVRMVQLEAEQGKNLQDLTAKSESELKETD